MAKGQLRGNREAKKPKATKKPAVEAVSPFNKPKPVPAPKSSK